MKQKHNFFDGICTEDEAELIAQKFFEQYSLNQKNIQNEQIKQMFEDTNFCLNLDKQVTQDEINQFKYTIDFDKDGDVTFKDIQELARKSLLCIKKNPVQQKQVWIQKFQTISEDLFKKFDIEKSNNLSIEEIIYLIGEIYKQSGIKNIPNETEIKSLSLLFNQEKDGLVTFNEYSRVIKIIIDKISSQLFN